MANKEADEVAPLAPHLSTLSGLLMGAADAIPGVSGGTIALIIGVYHRFIEQLSTAVKLPFLLRNAEGRGRLKAALAFLLPLGIGIIISYYIVTLLLVGPSENPGILLKKSSAPICYGFFFGLVLFSLREPWRRINDKITPAHWFAALVGMAFAALFVGLPHQGGTPANWAIFLGGAGAICVMLLPGISGSLLLVILGQYTAITGAVHDRDMVLLAIFLGGIIFGLITFAPFLKYLMNRYHGYTMAALTGLMTGSLRALWPWKEGYDPKVTSLKNTGLGEHLPWVLLALLAGGTTVWLLAKLEKRILENTTSTKN